MSLGARLKNIRWLRVIAIWEMIAGVWGTVLLVQTFPQFRERDDSTVLIALFFALCASSFAAGLNLLRGERFGRRLSLVVQGVQILTLRTPALGWQIILGPYLILWWNGGDRVGVELGQTVQLFVAAPDHMTLLALNLAACFFFLLLVDEPRPGNAAADQMG